MALGDVCKTVFTLITQPITGADEALNLPAYRSTECCFELPVFADVAGTDDKTNDKTSFFYQKGPGVTGIAMFLERFEGGSWVEKKVLNNSDFGDFYDYGFFAVANKFNSAGYIINWPLVYNHIDLGAGSYRVRVNLTTVAGGIVQLFSCRYCLQLYTPQKAVKTVRFNYWLNGLLGDKDDRTIKVNYGKNIIENGLGWFNQIRVPGIFGYETRDYETEYRQFKNKSLQQLRNVATPNFTAFLDENLLPFWVHKKIMELMQSSYISVTDYNQGQNPDKYIDFQVNPSGNYEPNYSRFAQNSTVELTFAQKFNTFDWKPC